VAVETNVRLRSRKDIAILEKVYHINAGTTSMSFNCSQKLFTGGGAGTLLLKEQAVRSCVSEFRAEGEV